MIISVDNGISGASVALDPESGAMVDCKVMPVHVREGKKEIKFTEWGDWVSHLGEPSIVLIEEPLRFAKSAQSLRSMAISFGGLMGYCQGKGWRVLPIGVKEWQKEMLGKFASGKSKEAALAKAKEICPEGSWIDPRMKRAYKDHGGIVDAYLIGQYYLSK